MLLRFVYKQKTRTTCSIITSGRLRCWMSTKVMSFGDGSQGALGLPSSSVGIGFDAYEPTPVPGLPPDITTLSVGHYHSLALTSQGHLYSWGRNNDSQLGPTPNNNNNHNNPQKIQGLDQVRVQSAFASGVISSAIGHDGSLWVWGNSKRGQLGLGHDITESVLPTRVQSLVNHHVVKVSFGWGHALALTKDGKLFGWGYYADGRIGDVGNPLEASPLDSVATKVKTMDGVNTEESKIDAAERLVLEAIEKENEMPVVWEPTLVREVCDVEVVDVACGLDHSLVLCSDGALLSGGSNVYGQLGRVNEDFGFHRVEISLRPISIASGLGHSLAVCKNEEDGVSVVTWGWNQSGQLGREGPENVPLVVDGLEGEMPVSVCGGRVHSLAVTGRGEVWAWGCGRNGRLGLGSSADETEPILVECLQGYQVLQAVAGFDHNLVLVAE